MPGNYGYKKKSSGPSFRTVQSAFNSRLKEGTFTHFYIFYGSQSYLRNQNRDKVRDALLSEDPSAGSGSSMNYTVFRGKNFDARQVIEIADTLPFFAERRVILFENTGILQDSAMSSAADELTDYLPRCPQTTFLVFSEASVDSRRRLYKSLTAKKEDCTAICVDEIDTDSIRLWAAKRFADGGCRIGNGVLDLFLQYTGEDMLHVESEIDKLCAYVGAQGTVMAQDVKAIVTPVLSTRIFEMTDAIAARDRRMAVNIYMDLLRLNTAPQQILAIMTSQYRSLMQVRELDDKHMDYEAIARETGMNKWAVKNYYQPACRKYSSLEEIRDAFERCVRASDEYKRGLITDEMAVEILVAAG